MVRHNVYPGDAWVVDELFKDALSNLKADIYNAAQNELVEELENAIVDSIYKRVYAAYHPSLYVRRAEKNGIADTSQYMVATYGGRTLTTTVEITLPFVTEDGADLINIIETGNGYTWVHSRIYEEHLPRPFMQEAAQDIINDKSALGAIADGLIRLGWNVKNPYIRKHTPKKNHKSPNTSMKTQRAWEDWMESQVYKDGYASDDF